MDNATDDEFVRRIIEGVDELIKSGEFNIPPPSPVDNIIKEIINSASSVVEEIESVPVSTNKPERIEYFETNPGLIALVETDRSNPPQTIIDGESVFLSHIQLHGGASPLNVAHVVAKLFRMAEFHAAFREEKKSPPETIKALCSDFPAVLPGGLAVIDNGIFIGPSCCTRFPESLMDWKSLLISGHQPWLGHDPTPWVELQDDNFLVWPDDGQETKQDATNKPARFTRDELNIALENVQKDTRDFLVPLRSWAMRFYPADAEELVACFTKAFVDSNGDEIKRGNKPMGDKHE